MGTFQYCLMTLVIGAMVIFAAVMVSNAVSSAMTRTAELMDNPASP